MLQVWIAPGTGLATPFLKQLEAISSDSTALMIAIFAVFAVVHSGLAYLRPYGMLCPGPSVILAALHLDLLLLDKSHCLCVASS